MIERNTNAARFAAVLLTAMWINSAHAAITPEQKCQAGRAKAAGRLQACVQKEIAATFGDDLDQAALSSCRIKYANTWNKLQLLVGTTCDVARFVDNGDGTVTDNLSALVWEKKDELDGIHNKDTTYSWTTSDGDLTDEDGTVFTDFLATLNAGEGFAGANGWRLPTFVELLTIVLPEPYICVTNPCIDPIFGPTNDPYMTSTTYGNLLTSEWLISFSDGSAGTGVGKSNAIYYYARAVRGGL